MNSDNLEFASWQSSSLEAISAPALATTGRLVSYSLPAPDVSLERLLLHAQGKPRFFWQRGGERAIYAGFGTAVQLMAWGESRFREIQAAAEVLFSDSAILGPHAAPLLPRLFGGFSFRSDFTPDNAWSVFHPAHFVLPHYQFFSTGSEQWLTINALAGDDEDLAALRDQLHNALQARYEHLLAAGDGRERRSANRIVETRYPMSYERWQKLVSAAVEAMQDGHLRKVVLARACELRSESRIDIYEAVEQLNAAFAECTRFLFEPRPYHAFYGATPELLISLMGNNLTTMALAGSKQRGNSESDDEALGQELFADAKERLEHSLVVEAIKKRLEPITTDLIVPQVPELYRLSYIQHLLTPISGKLTRGEGVLPLVELLHPTPALGGSPREAALAFIGENEPVARGWYAGPVGWFDSQMNGEFVVAIRSAVAQERRVWCYAGAGIVPHSKPDLEWAETDLKFRPMLNALGVH